MSILSANSTPLWTQRISTTGAEVCAFAASVLAGWRHKIHLPTCHLKRDDMNQTNYIGRIIANNTKPSVRRKLRSDGMRFMELSGYT
jgi:hypothetical protein